METTNNNFRKFTMQILGLICYTTGVFAQKTDYAISSYQTEGVKAPNTHYIGEAWLNPLLRADDDLDYNITKATFKANSTLDWHKHESVQVLIIVDGVGYYQEKGKEAVLVKEGDVIRCEKNTEHWHSSSKHKDVTYLAIYGGETPTVWTEVVSQAYYDKVAERLN
ncbi:cupin domain-containing protein [Croceivirga radicis]|nr:cupin domain-containing protein [Croceivirga radicis]